MKRLQELEQKANNQGLSKVSCGDICNEPINPCVPMRSYPKRFKMPRICNFKSKEDPKENLRHFKHACYMIVNDNALLLRTFSMNLKGQAMNWYNALAQHSLYSFEQLANTFIENFSINTKRRASIIDLMKLSQFNQDSILNYVARWRYLIIDMKFSLPQEELVRLFSKSIIK